MKKIIILISLLVSNHLSYGQNDGLDWERIEIQPDGRIDAIAYFGNGVVIAGTRKPNPGFVYKSNNFGKTWEKISNVTGDDYITCIASSEDGIGYLLTGVNVHIWKTTDYGDTWKDMGQIAQSQNTEGFANAYSLLITEKGTLLASTANSSGGQILRSEDGGATWSDVGKISPRALYRLNKVGDGVIVNGWGNHIYKSYDDGLTWHDKGKLMDSDLYAIEYLGNGIALIATKSGHVFRSADNGETWNNLGLVDDGNAADDFAYMGGAKILYSTYTGSRKNYISSDGGLTWTNVGTVDTGKKRDWLDHVIYISDQDKRLIVGGTNKGYILRFAVK